MSRGSREKAIQLTFATLPCQRCGEQRILAQSCSSCGMKPRAGEVNHHVQRRRQLVADALAKLSAPPQQSTPQEIHLLSREAGTVFPQIQSALRRGAADGVSGAELALALDRINRLVASTSTPQLRPMSTIGRRLHEATTLLKSAVNVYLDAFVAPTLREAQDLARTGQDRLDDAAAKAADLPMLWTARTGSRAQVLMTPWTSWRRFWPPPMRVQFLRWTCEGNASPDLSSLRTNL